METDPTHFGFTNITDPCLTTTVCSDPDHTLFWDTHHPTVFGNDIMAVNFEVVLTQQKSRHAIYDRSLPKMNIEYGCHSPGVVAVLKK